MQREEDPCLSLFLLSPPLSRFPISPLLPGESCSSGKTHPISSLLVDKDRDLLKPNMCWDEMVGQHCRPNGHEFEQAQGDGEGQESLAC